ncbi:colanic acid biosynthesis glycosyltransferase WcaC [Sinimarinibacterium sp. CAU 1509]|uniref:glycosyltransferase n=1 Tax=Sinimarinibacterium sp. CAU 1509 TaxID=2562283 RepID=UPI0010AD577B|nr:glycosyltransferase [Sinimarinibacterium sp. CAU 1509]TJY61955.1 colanic acid biosynthesis glycosyltransferase WcaC [Sinimarinibacterium sp. CAU 1509]
MKVLHINVRLQEGGAARVALDLHRHLLTLNVESVFAYGWGENGGKSSGEASVPKCFQAGQQFQVAANMLLHRLIGVDSIKPLGFGRKRLLCAIHWADVVHLHVIHSHFLPLDWLVHELVRLKKPVIWTAHDYWMLTGRCAFTEECQGWRRGCGECPTQQNYPPALMNYSAHEFKRKRKIISLLGSRLHVVTPSAFVANAIIDGLPNVAVSVIPNWVDSGLESALKNVQLSNSSISFSEKSIKVIFIASDLSDPTKVDRALVNQLLALPHIELHTVGSQSPFSGSNVINHGRISDRKQIVDVIVRADVALFTSEKDTFGLVMIEALACGVPVFAVSSMAAEEVLSVLNILPVGSCEEIYCCLRDKVIPECYLGASRASLHRDALKKYSRTVLADKYIDLYKAVTGQSDANQ